jgi:hypothetical protein
MTNVESADAHAQYAALGVTQITRPMNAYSKSPRLSSSGAAWCCSGKKDDDMTKTEIKNDVLTDAELDGVVGGLNSQPLPPDPPPESLFATRFSFNRVALAGFSFF